MKRLLVILLSMILMFSVTGCARNNSGGNNEGGDTVFVTVMEAGLGESWIKALADAYFEETGIEVKVSADPQLVTNVSTKMGSSSSDDKDDLYFVAQANNSWLSYATRDLLEPLDSVLASDVYGTPAKDRVREETPLKMGKYLDKDTYTTPYFYTSWGLIYNGDLLNKFESNGKYVKGQFPTTVQGILDLCESVVKANITNTRTGRTIRPFSVGLNVSYMNQIFFSLWNQLDAAGYQAYFDQNDFTGYQGNLLKTPASIKAAETIFDIIGAKDETTSNMVSTAQNHLESQTSFVNGDCVFTFSGSWFETEMKKIMEEVGLTNIHFAPYPTFNEGEKSSMVINYPGENFFIPKDALNVVGAKDFLAFCLSERGVKIVEETVSQSTLFTTSEKTEMTTFGNEIRDAVANTNRIYMWSENLVYRSGALSLFKAEPNPFIKMATCKIKDKSEIVSKMFDAEIIQHNSTWDDSMSIIPEDMK